MKRMKRVNIFQLTVLSIIALLFFSCSKREFKGIKGEGIVEYDITYLKNNLQGFAAYMLPKKMTLEFSERYTVNTIENMLGLISIKNINDLKEDTVTTAFKYSSKKYFYTSKPKETPCCFEILERPRIELLDDSMLIAGKYCKKANVKFSEKEKNHTVYYTDFIEADIINKNTAYEDIPGILMEFQMKIGNLEMLFKASKIKLQKIDTEQFDIPEGYKRINRDNMVNIINELLE